MFNRRKFLINSSNFVTYIFLFGCDNKNQNSPHKGSKGMITAPTLDELNLLNHFDLRQGKFPETPLIVRDREFNSSIRFDDFHWENTQFINCDFYGCLMFRGNLKNVQFENCAFVGNRFEDGKWENVSFLRCAGRGSFSCGTTSGKNTIYDDCEFIGATPAELGYGGRADSYGGIGGGDGDVTYRKCHLKYMFANGGSSLTMQDCILNEVVVGCKNKSRMLLENIKGDGTVQCENIENPATSMTIKNSVFLNLSLEDSKVNSVLLENIKANVDLSILKAHDVTLRKVMFSGHNEPNIEFRYGLKTGSAKIENLLIEDCEIIGKQVALHLTGKPVNEFFREKALKEKKKFVNLSSTTFGTLTIRNTPVIMGHMEYMEVGTLLFENLTVRGVNFSHGEFGQFILRNVALSGVVDFTDTKIKERIYERVENTSTGTQPTILKP